jgi:SPP1 family predicted phage head-tail adaptor
MTEPRASELQFVADVLQRPDVSDSGAPQQGDWEAVYENVWCRLRALRGQSVERLGYQQDQAVTEIVIRHKADITNRMRIKLRGESGDVSYDIGHVEDGYPERPRRWTRLVCTRAEDTD